MGSGADTLADAFSECGPHFRTHTCTHAGAVVVADPCTHSLADAFSECGAYSSALTFTDTCADTGHTCALAHGCTHTRADGGSDPEPDTTTELRPHPITHTPTIACTHGIAYGESDLEPVTDPNRDPHTHPNGFSDRITNDTFADDDR